MGNINYKELNECGIVIYQIEKGYGIQKVSTPKDNRSFNEKFFENEDFLKEFINSFFEEEKKVYKAIIRFDRGLGIEYKTIENIHCQNEAEAEKMALETSKLLNNCKVGIAEIKIRKQN